MCKHFDFVFTDNARAKMRPKDMQKMGWSIKVFDADGQRLSAASYHAAGNELVVRCTKVF